MVTPSTHIAICPNCGIRWNYPYSQQGTIVCWDAKTKLGCQKPFEVYPVENQIRKRIIRFLPFTRWVLKNWSIKTTERS